ncbi:YihY/virulence factor BrkB family protein [Halobaculum marinum]|uniref:YhjD/YihY/BrkB family envelope integrity protein n=1 Tax=Halobaculum marinum TaxID=3031996 RepID=A0ABD5WV67_9EURY|nr:YihY/virulence factor BrkB family protein [Halobaculum sp. DT55]
MPARSVAASAREAASLLRDVVARGREAGVGFLAAAVAYYALVSLVPLVALAALALATVAGEAVADRVVLALGDSLSVSGRDTVRRVFTTAVGRSQATVVGAVVLVWGASRLFRGLDRAVGRVYRLDDGGGTVRRARDAAVVLAAVVTAVVAAVGVDLLVPVSDPSGPVGRATAVTVRVAVLSGLLFPAYYVLPDTSLSIREALPGSVLAGVGWAALYAAFDAYVAASAGGALSGALGAVVLVVTWLYAASVLLLAGAVVNAVVAGH